MSIRVISCCMNEEDMLPFYLQYYSSFVDQIVIYDGGSTDKSLEIISHYNKALVIKVDHPFMDERNLTSIRNEAYKIEREKFDWQIIVDIDEFLYDINIINKLNNYKNKGITLPKVIGYDMYSLTFPEFDKNKTIIDMIKTGRRNDIWQSKRVVFNPSAITINYAFGCHQCFPTGNIVESNNNLLLLHYNYVGYDHFIKKHKYNTARMSEFNLQNNLAYHIPMFSKMTRETFNKKVQDEAKDIVFY